MAYVTTCVIGCVLCGLCAYHLYAIFFSCNKDVFLLGVCKYKFFREEGIETEIEERKRGSKEERKNKMTDHKD